MIQALDPYAATIGGVKADPYRILLAYNITHPAQQHALKKLLRAGRSHKPLAQDIDASGAMYANAIAGIRDQLPESYRGIADASVARESSSASRLADAYRAQAALTPMYNQMTQYQQDQNSFAAQLFSQQMAQQAAGYNGGGSTSAQAQAITDALQLPTG